MIPDDVETFIARKFGDSDREEARRLLGTATIHGGSPAEPRLLRCAAMASGGSIDRLRYYVELLRIDHRDVIMAGEYTASLKDPRRVRDFNREMPDDSST